MIGLHFDKSELFSLTLSHEQIDMYLIVWGIATDDRIVRYTLIYH